MIRLLRRIALVVMLLGVMLFVANGIAALANVPRILRFATHGWAVSISPFLLGAILYVVCENALARCEDAERRGFEVLPPDGERPAA